MNRKPTLTIFNSPRKTIGKYAYPFILITFFIVLGSTSSLIHAQKTIMRMEMNTPEWNGKQECDKGNGYRLSPINVHSEGLAPGEYELLVQDASCSTTKKLSTSTSNTN